MIGLVRSTSSNVKRWQNGDCARETAAGMLEAERRFRKIIGYRAVTQLDAPHEPAQPILIGWHRVDLDTIAVLIKQAVIQPPAAQIQSSVQHEDGPPSSSLLQ
jgi:hypothetical protein